MHLRTRLAEQINARIALLMPEAARTVWDGLGVVVVIEQAKFTPAGGVVGDCELEFSLTGTVVAELRSDDLARADVAQEFLASLIGDPIFLTVEPVSVGALTETARATLTEMRLLSRDAVMIQSLRFDLSAEVLRRLKPAIVPYQVTVPAPLQGVPE